MGERVEIRTLYTGYAGLLKSWPISTEDIRLRREYAISSLSSTVGKDVLKYYERRFSHEA